MHRADRYDRYHDFYLYYSYAKFKYNIKYLKSSDYILLPDIYYQSRRLCVKLYRMGLRRASHGVCDCEYHLVWCPKYRKKLFGQESLRERAKELFSKMAEEYEYIIEELEVATDHVHILVSFPPRYSVSTVVKTLKSISARELFQEHPYLRKRLWKGKLWEHRYFVRTVGDEVTTDIIKQYIKYHEVEKQSPAQLDIFKLR